MELNNQISELYKDFDALYCQTLKNVEEAEELLNAEQAETDQFRRSNSEMVDEVFQPTLKTLTDNLISADGLIKDLGDAGLQNQDHLHEREIRLSALRSRWENVKDPIIGRSLALDQFISRRDALDNIVKSAESRLQETLEDTRISLPEKIEKLQTLSNDLEESMLQLGELIKVANSLKPLKWPADSTEELRDWIKRIHQAAERDPDLQENTMRSE